MLAVRAANFASWRLNLSFSEGGLTVRRWAEPKKQWQQQEVLLSSQQVSSAASLSSRKAVSYDSCSEAGNWCWSLRGE